MRKFSKWAGAVCGLLALILMMNAVQLPVLATQLETSAPPATLAAAPTETTAAEPTLPTEENVAVVQLETLPAAEPTLSAAEPTVPAEPVPTEEIPASTLPMISGSLELPPEPDPGPITTIPLYYQNDYPTVRYGSGTVAKNGCSIVSLAMVATYLTGQEYYPDQLATWFGGNGNNNMQRLEYGAAAMQLPFTPNTNWHLSRQALKEGKVVIALMNNKSMFTQTQHFIVITGMTADGRFLVNDPYKPNYDRWEMKDGFANGFEEWQIDVGYEGGWVFDKSAMPEEPFLYWEDPYDYDHGRYQVRLEPEEINLIMRLVWVEAQGEPFEGQQAVAEVVLNRLVGEGFASNVRDVVYGPGQFQSAAFLKDAEPNQTQYDAVMAALYGENILPMEATYFSTSPTSDQLVTKIGNHYFCIPD